MTDYFSLLQQPRRPWLDPEILKQQFLTLSAAAHPDRFHGRPELECRAANERFSQLNAAHACLREPRDRLRHLLELETGRKPSDLQEIPDVLANLLLEVAALCREADGFLARREAITSPLLRAQNFEQVQQWMDRLNQPQKRIAALQAACLARLRQLDSTWSEAGDRKSLLLELEQICRQLGFFARWEGQLQERVHRLMF